MKKINLLRSVCAPVLCAGLSLSLLSGCGSSQAPAASKAESVAETAAAGTSAAKEAGTTENDDFEAKVADWKPDQNTITLRVSTAAGSTGDLIYRLIANHIQKTTGTTTVVQNITGSNGFLMATDLTSYDPSACELMLGTEALFVVAPLFNEGINVSMDDFEILYGSPSNAPSALAVPASLGIKTWDEFVEYSKNNRIIVSSNVPGGMTHIQATALMGSAGIEFGSVTDNGGNKNILACLNGDANCVVVNTTALHDYVESGQMVPLVQFSSETFNDDAWGLDPIPSVSEIGYPKIAVSPCTVLCCRKDADPVGVEAMRRIITDYLNSDEGKKELLEIDSTLTPISAEEAKEHLENEIETMKYIKDTFYK
ncbi:hypothetical protein UYO_1019 [Lachnospiraceae bacterium JC7]|nr:hypothetical protein UYO_1019 [Lachnospiraceae bacterium JC7]